MANDKLYEVVYKHRFGYGETKLGILQGMSPVAWWEHNKDKIDLLRWENVTPHEVEGLEFVPMVVGNPVHIDLR